MDISSGDVAFKATCPGTLMRQLQSDVPQHVRNIKSLQLCFSASAVTYMCTIGEKDLSIVIDFIAAVDALQTLSVTNHEPDAAMLWPAVLRHASSLETLAIHTPPQGRSNVWLPKAFPADHLESDFKRLRNMELDVPLEEAEARIASRYKAASVLQTVANMDAPLEKVVINVVLSDKASAFAARHTWNAMGCISFPDPDIEACEKLAQQIFNLVRKPTLKELHLRFPRRCWDDRCQFSTSSYSVRVKVDTQTKAVTVEPDEAWAWEQYLPGWPQGGLLREMCEEAIRASWSI